MVLMFFTPAWRSCPIQGYVLDPDEHKEFRFSGGY